MSEYFCSRLYIHFQRKMMTPSPKKWSCALKIFSPVFSKKLLFFEKIVKWKNIQNLISHKKVIFIFVAGRPLPFKRDLGPRNWVLPFSQKIQLFLKKLLNNKVFSTSFGIKKVMLIFGARRSLKNCQKYLQKYFYHLFGFVTVNDKFSKNW